PPMSDEWMKAQQKAMSAPCTNTGDMSVRSGRWVTAAPVEYGSFVNTTSPGSQSGMAWMTSPTCSPRYWVTPDSRGYAKNQPSRVTIPAPKSWDSLANVVYAVRSIVALISSAIADSMLLKTASSMGSEGFISVLAAQVEGPDRIHLAHPAWRHHAG